MADLQKTDTGKWVFKKIPALMLTQYPASPAGFKK
jgi:hypothetical protein